MKFKSLYLLLLSTAFIGCTHTHYHPIEHKTKTDFEKDRLECFTLTNKRLNISNSEAKSTELISYRDSLIEACMEEEKGWDQESLNWIFDYKFKNYIKKDTK